MEMHQSKYVLITLIIGFSGMLSMSAAVFARSTEGPTVPLIGTVAHRGASGYAPENTFSAFDKAIDMKADYLELDVQLCKDNKLVVIHDPTVDRTTNGSGKVQDLTWERLRSLDAGSDFGVEFAGERIPLLDEVLERYAGKIGIVIELKEPGLNPGIEQKAADALTRYDLNKGKNGKVIVQSFDPNAILRFKQIVPDVPVGILVRTDDGDITDDELESYAAFAQFVNPQLDRVNKSLVDRIHRLGMGVIAWTVRRQEDVSSLWEAGVDGIFTDYPDYTNTFIVH
jgi:glycerophosphoryl diester phosphodiesterase